MSRGFAISGRTAPEQIPALAAAAEALGYGSFWITVLPGETDPVAVLAAALEATERVDVGLGLIPLDSFAPASTAAAIAALAGAPRAVVALGVGSRHRGAARFWAEQAGLFRASARDLRIAVGGYGPLVLAAGGAVADAVLLNWMIPARVGWALACVDRGAEAARRPPPRPAYVYVPVAVGGEARVEIATALRAMRAHAYHRRHQQEMGAGEEIGLAVEKPGEDVEAFFDRYREYAPVVNSVSAPDADRQRELMRALAPPARRSLEPVSGDRDERR